VKEDQAESVLRRFENVTAIFKKGTKENLGN